MKASFVLGLSLFVTGLAACGGGDGSGSNGGSGGSTATGGAGGTTVEVACANGGSPSFPTFDRACMADGDCVIALHQINCCGTLDALGIASAEKAAFDEAEATCESQYPACGCAQGPTTTDEGSTATDLAAISVQCIGGQCTTYVP